MPELEHAPGDPGEPGPRGEAGPIGRTGAAGPAGPAGEMPELTRDALVALGGVTASMDAINVKLDTIAQTARAAEKRAAEAPTRRALRGVLLVAAFVVVALAGTGYATYRSAQADLSRQVSVCFLATPADPAVIDACDARFPGYRRQVAVGQDRLKQFSALLAEIPGLRERIERLEEAAAGRRAAPASLPATARPPPSSGGTSGLPGSPSPTAADGSGGEPPPAVQPRAVPTVGGGGGAVPVPPPTRTARPQPAPQPAPKPAPKPAPPTSPPTSSPCAVFLLGVCIRL